MADEESVNAARNTSSPSSLKLRRCAGDLETEPRKVSFLIVLSAPFTFTMPPLRASRWDSPRNPLHQAPKAVAEVIPPGPTRSFAVNNAVGKPLGPVAARNSDSHPQSTMSGKATDVKLANCDASTPGAGAPSRATANAGDPAA